MNQKLARAVIFKSDGDVCIHYFDAEEPTLKEMQNIVDGPIEFIHLPENQIMVVNEEGFIHHMPFNQPAVNYLHEHGITHIPVVGNAFVLKSDLIS